MHGSHALKRQAGTPRARWPRAGSEARRRRPGPTGVVRAWRSRVSYPAAWHALLCGERSGSPLCIQCVKRCRNPIQLSISKKVRCGKSAYTRIRRYSTSAGAAFPVEKDSRIGLPGTAPLSGERGETLEKHDGHGVEMRTTTREPSRQCCPNLPCSARGQTGRCVHPAAMQLSRWHIWGIRAPVVLDAGHACLCMFEGRTAPMARLSAKLLL
jgi:hypothetical protein